MRVIPIKTSQIVLKESTMASPRKMSPLNKPYINNGSPMAMQTSNILLPKAFDIASSVLPFPASVILRNMSGMLVAAAAITRAITGTPKLNSFPNLTQSSTRKKHPAPTPIRPNMNLVLRDFLVAGVK